MGTPVRWFFLCILAVVGLVLFHRAHALSQSETPDATALVTIFGSLVLIGLAAGGLLASMLLPLLGDRLAAFFYNSGGHSEPTPYSEAISRLAQGDAEGAVEAYEQIYAKNPADTHALGEAARICCRDIGDTARGAAMLERALKRDWPPDQAAFLANRLADIYLLQEDIPRARQMLLQIVHAMGDTPHTTQALHRLRDLDRTLEPGQTRSLPG